MLLRVVGWVGLDGGRRWLGGLVVAVGLRRYAFKFLDEVNPVVDAQELEAMHEEVEQEERQWERDVLQRIKKEELLLAQEPPAPSAQDEELLFYEVVT
jgi:hypothetical protein